MLSCIDPIGAVSVQWINDQQTKKSLSDYDTHGSVRIYCVRNSCFINSVITCSAEPVNFITHFLSPEQDLCTSTSALRILLFFFFLFLLHVFLQCPVALLPSVQAETCVGRKALRIPLPCFGSSVASPSSMVASAETHSGLRRRKSGLQLCFLKQRIMVLYGMGVNSMDFGGRSGPDSWLCHLASCVNSLRLGCLVCWGKDRNSSSLIVTWVSHQHLRLDMPDTLFSPLAPNPDLFCFLLVNGAIFFDWLTCLPHSNTQHSPNPINSAC